LSNEIKCSSEDDDIADFMDAINSPDMSTSPSYGKVQRAMSKAEIAVNGAQTGMPTQWARHGAGYAPTRPTVETIPSGCYDIVCDNDGTIFCSPMLEPTGLVLELPEMRSEHVVKTVERFWESENDYKIGNEFVHGGAAYRCGIMLYGPPGTGKTVTIRIVGDKLSERGGVVFHSTLHPMQINHFLTSFRRIEPDRKCVVIMEDIDSAIQQWGEAPYLQMLDGAQSINNCMFLVTTNYPEKLDPRIYNRPGRLSHVIKIGLPGKEARRAFLSALLKNKRDLEELVAKTDGFSIDHISALVSGIYREHKDLNEEIVRLRSLFRIPNAGVEGPTIGLGLGK
jgi:hypothetical protein